MAIARTRSATTRTRSKTTTTATTKTSSTASTANNNNKKTNAVASKTSKRNKKLIAKADNSPSKENRCITDYFPVVSRRQLAQAKAQDEYRKRILESIDNQTDPTENLIITEFEGKGKGVVAGNVIGKGSFVCEYAGDLINLDEAKVSLSHTNLRLLSAFLLLLTQ